MSVSGTKELFVKDWDDWFALCGRDAPELEFYEKCMDEYYDRQYSETDDGRRSASVAFRGKHESSFWKNKPLVPGWKRRHLTMQGILWVLIFAAVCFGACMALDKFTKLHDWFGESFVQKAVMLCIGAGVLGFVLRFGLPFLAHRGKIKRLIKRMSGIEESLKEQICYIPPKYRNSMALRSFYDIYQTYGVVPMTQALSATDQYLSDNRSLGVTMAVMFDVPYRNADPKAEEEEASSGDRGLYHGDEDMSDPDLPGDIKEKTFSGVEDAEKKLDSMVGLEQVKTQIRQMKNRIAFYGSSGTERISGNHMVFLGSPGTGKTTVARIITRILYDFGYIRQNKCVEIDGSYLKSPYVGQTAQRSSAILRYAEGGVLFIDEAYTLFDEKGGAGTEALGVLLKAMEDKKDDLVVILAGYEDNINRLIGSNEGFSSRIKYKIYFEDFSEEELVQIFTQMLSGYSKSTSYSIEPEALELLRAHFVKEKAVPGFGNARVVRNALDVILDNHADRFMKHELPEEKRNVIVKEDVESYLKVRLKQMQEDGRNFIASRNLDSTVVSLSELKGRTKDGSADPDKDLEALTGLSQVKEEIAQMKAQFDFYGGKIESEGHHMVFYGPPGTGKTTVAAIMTGYLYQMGIIRENRYLDINGDFLRGMYLGHTGKRTEAVVQYSQGMVLFVDEAYLLQSSNESDNFGAEAIGVLLDAMEKNRKGFVVIFAGYDREMESFLNANSGLRSRISKEFHFRSYTPKELCQMMKRLAKTAGFKVDSSVWIPLQEYLRERRKDPYFGNGRYIRSFFEECKQVHIVNYSKGVWSESEKFVIGKEDVLQTIAMQSEEPAETDEIDIEL